VFSRVSRHCIKFLRRSRSLLCSRQEFYSLYAPPRPRVPLQACRISAIEHAERPGTDQPRKFTVVIKDLIFERELDTHRIPAIASSPFFRQLKDMIDSKDKGGQEFKQLVYEWMDTDLWTAGPYGSSLTPSFLKSWRGLSWRPSQSCKISAVSIPVHSYTTHAEQLGPFNQNADISANNVNLSDLDQVETRQGTFAATPQPSNRCNS
jgi:hypothetical protein